MKCKLVNSGKSHGYCVAYETIGPQMIGVHFVCLCCQGK